jgi:mannose-6-phosphate isomerase-like protein (cupin superfamily)
MASFNVADVDDLAAEGPGGTVRKVRKAVDGKAFGFNYFKFPPNKEGYAHDESQSRQEEVFFVVKGSGKLKIDGEEVELKPGRFVRISPEATRQPISGSDGLEFVMFGAPVDGTYEPPSWG